MNKDIYNAYYRRDKPNEIHFFESVAKILAQTADSNDNIGAFIPGMSRDYFSSNKDGQHVFNMFIDFAYAGSFNYFDIPLKCVTKFALQNFRNYPVVDSSYRAFSFAIVLKRNENNLPQNVFWGDDQSTQYRLHYKKRKSFNIFNNELIQRAKITFGKSAKDKEPVLNKFEEGVFGTSSRFNLLMHHFSELILPRISLRSVTFGDDTKLTYWNDEDTTSEEEPLLLKSKAGSLLASFEVKGCLEGYEIWTQSGVKLSPVYSEYVDSTHSYLVDLKVPLDLMENPFDPGNKYEEAKEKPPVEIAPLDKPADMNQNQIPLTIMMDKNTQNLQSIKLNLRCVLKHLNVEKFDKFYPQSHLIKGFVDPGYFAINVTSKQVEYKNANNIFQLTIQDVSTIEERQLIRQTNLSSIEVISDFDLFFRTNDETSLRNIVDFRMKSEDVMFEVGDDSLRLYSAPIDPLKLLRFDETKNRIEFHKNLELLSTYWDIEFMSFADIGCCTTGTLGKSAIKITKKFRPYDRTQPSEGAQKVGHHYMQFSKFGG